MRDVTIASPCFGFSGIGLRVWLCLSLLLIAVSGCAIAPRATQTAGQIANRDANDLRDWQAHGRIAVSGASTGGSGSFTWDQRGPDAIVQIRGPVGIGSLRLTLSENGMRVATADGQQFVADDAQAELTARLGATVPAHDLRYWLLGIAAPGEHHWMNTADTSTLTQHDWRIDYQRFGVTAGTRLPMKLVAVSGPAKVRIVIDRWQVK